MHAFIVELENTPGTLADVTEALAEKGVNLSAAAGAGCGSTGVLGFVTSDSATTRSTLDERGWTHREVEIVAAALEDRPGTLADAARRIANAGVNIELAMAIGMDGTRIQYAFGVDNAPAARSALGELATVA